MDLTISRIFKIILSIIVIIAVGWLLYLLSRIITILIIAGLIAYILHPIANWLEYKGLSRTMATLVIFLVTVGTFTVIFMFFIPPLIHELSNIQHGLSGDSSTNYIQRLESFIAQNFTFINTEDLDLQGKLNNLLVGLSSSTFSLILDIFSVITALVVIPFAVFFLLKDGRHMYKSFISIIPNRYFEMVLNLIHQIDNQLGGYLRGQFFDALIIGLLATLACGLLGVKYFILIGIFAGLTNMIPYVGPWVGALSAILVVLMHGGTGQDVLMVGLAFLIIQLMDNVLVQPLVVAKSVDLHPMIVIFAVIIGGQFFGILGMLLAVPATGIIKVSLSELYRAVRKYRII